MTTCTLKTAYCLVLALWPVWAFGIEPDDRPRQQEEYPRVTCIINEKGYSVHFSAYLKPSADETSSDESDVFLPHCQEIPSTGKVHFTMDFLDRGVRGLPVAVRVVRESVDDPSDSALGPSKLADVPAKIYPTGIIEVEAALNHAGRYAVFLTVDKLATGGKEQVRIPLQVAPGGWPPLLIIGIVAVAGAAGFAFYRGRRVSLRA